MDITLLNKLEILLSRYKFLEEKLSDSDVFNNNVLFLDLSKERASLKNIVLSFIRYKKVCEDVINVKSLLDEKNLDIKDLILEELKNLEEEKLFIEVEFKNFFFPKEKYFDNNIFLEFRAATGGDESAIFVEDLFKMYSNYFIHNKWVLEVMSFSYGNCGGYKELTARVIGKNVFEKMKNESGIHRVQRVPKTDSYGRVHTSTCTVAVLPELEIIDEISLDLSDLRIDTYRASGAGGQHVNVTDSAVRIIHKPTGIMAECQDERSQHKNKQKALSLLKSRLLLSEKTKQKYEIDDYRRRLIGTGSRSEKIRTYNYIGNRVTDHRYNITIHKLSDIMNGKLWLLLDNLK